MFDSHSLQTFSLPDSIIYSLTKNPSNPNGYQKLIQTCKYFFAKNPILVIHCLEYFKNMWETCLVNMFGRKNRDCYKKEYKKYSYFKNTVAKIWITNFLIIHHIDYFQPSNIVSTIIPKFYKQEILNVSLWHLVISTNELLVFHKIHRLTLYFCNVLSNSGSILPLEEIIDCFPELLYFAHVSNKNVPCITKDTVRKLTKNISFIKLKYFVLLEIPEIFDLEDFYKYLKKNKVTNIFLKFSDSISEEYKNRLEKIVDEILQNDSPDYKIPIIYYPGIDDKKEKALYRRFSE